MDESPVEAIILGELYMAADGFRGWCWSPERPRDRLVVELLVDHVIVSTVVAAQRRPELLDRKISDGFHGFFVRMPQDNKSAPPELVEARERSSGQVFGRLTSTAFTRIRKLWDKRLDALSERMEVISQRIDDSKFSVAQTAVGSGLKALGNHLTSRAGLDKIPIVRLPWVTKPTVSIVIDTTVPWERIFRAASIVVHLVERLSAELILVDDGRNPDTFRLRGYIIGLSYAFDPNMSTTASRMNLAMRVARGHHLVFLSADHLSGPGLLELLGDGGKYIPSLRIGPSVMEAALATGLFNAHSPQRRFCRIGLRLHIDRTLLQHIGGFEESLDDGEYLSDVDLILKAELLGVSAAVWAEPELIAALPRQHSGQAEIARLSFFDRWGVCRT